MPNFTAFMAVPAPRRAARAQIAPWPALHPSFVRPIFGDALNTPSLSASKPKSWRRGKRVAYSHSAPASAHHHHRDKAKEVQAAVSSATPIDTIDYDHDRDPRSPSDEDIAAALACAESTTRTHDDGLSAEDTLSRIPIAASHSRRPSKEVREAIFGTQFTIDADMGVPSHSKSSSSPHRRRATREEEDQMLHAWAEERVTGFYLRSTAMQGAKKPIARSHPVDRTLYYSLLRYKCELEINDRCERIGRFAPCFTEPVVLDDGCMLYGRRFPSLPRPGKSPLCKETPPIDLQA